MKKLRVILSVIMALCLSIGIVACGKTKTATVTFDLGYEGATNFTQSVAVENSAVEPKDPARDGYEFGGWYTDSTFATAYEFAAKVDADKSVYAKWNKINTIAYDLKGGEFDEYRPVNFTVATGSAFALHPAPQKDKAAFAGWKVGTQVYTPGSNVTLAADGDVTVEAVWTNQYTVTFVDYDGTEIDVQTVNEGEAAIAPEFAGTARPNYRFAEAWSVDFDEVDSDMTVTAEYVYVSSEDMFFTYTALKEGYETAADGDDLIGYAVAVNSDNKNTIPADLVLPREHNGLDIVYVGGFDALTIESVFVPNTVIVIGNEAFRNCASLVEIEYEDGCQVEVIGDYAFAGKDKNVYMMYREIYIPASVKTIGNSAYRYTFNKTTASAPSNPLTSLIFEEGSVLETIGDYAFGDETTHAFHNKQIDKIVIPASVKTIGERAFYNIAKCIEFEADSKLETIGDYAFASKSVTSADSVRLTQSEFVIPASVKTVGKYTFYYQGMKVIRFEEGSVLTEIPEQFVAESDVTSIEIPASVEVIGVGAFKKSKISQITIPYTVKEIKTGAFQGVYSLAYLTFEAAPAGVDDASLIIGEDVFMGAQSGSSSNGYRIDGITLQTLEIPAHCVKIGARAFNYVEIATLTFKGGSEDPTKNTSKLAEIGEFAFAQIHPYQTASGTKSAYDATKDIIYNNKPLNDLVGSSPLKAVTIPASVKTFGAAIFAGNLSLDTVKLPTDMTEIPSGMFAFCPMLPVKTATIPTTVTKIGGFAFAGYQNGKTNTLKVAFSKGATVNMVNTTSSNAVDIKAGVTYIGPSAFAAHSTLKVTFVENAESTLTLGDYAFSMNSMGTSIPAVENTTQKTIELPAQVKAIPAHLFDGYNAITEYTFGEGITEIPEAFLQNNTSITSYEIPAQITKIGKGAFKASAVTSVTIAADNQLEVIGESAFEALAEITAFPFASATKLKTIEKQAFMGTSFASVEIPATVEYIGEKAFFDVLTLNVLTFAPTPAEGAVPLYINKNAFAVTTVSTANVASPKVESALTGTIQLPKRLAFFAPQAFYMTGVSAFTVEGNDVTKDSIYVARDGVLYQVTKRTETKEIEFDTLVSIPRDFAATTLETGKTTNAIASYAIAGTTNLQTFVGTSIKTYGEAYEYKLVEDTHTLNKLTTGITNVISYNQSLTSATFPALETIATTGSGVYGNPELLSFEIPATVTSFADAGMFGYNAKMHTIIIRSNYVGTTNLITSYGLDALHTIVYLGEVTKTNKVVGGNIASVKNVYLADETAMEAYATNAGFKLLTGAKFEIYDNVNVATDPVNETTATVGTPITVKVSVSSAPVVENTFNGYFVVEFAYQPEGSNPVVSPGFDSVMEIKNGVSINPQITFDVEGEYTLQVKLYKDLAEGEDEFVRLVLLRVVVAAAA